MSPPLSVLPPDRQRSLVLADGRLLAWSEWGAEGDRSVLFCTGAGMSGSLGFATGEARDLGVRLVAVDRPGLGRSTPHPDRTLVSWAEDVSQLVRELGADSPPAVGFSQGSVFALALARAGVSRSVALVSGQDQLDHPPILALLPAPVARLVRDAATDPEGVERHLAESMTAEVLWALVIEMSGPEDRALYGSEPFSGTYRRTLAEGFAQGPRGYARDTLLSIAPWGFAPEEVPGPVHLWYGLRDTSPVHSPDFGATLAARIPGARLHRLSGEGSAILWSRGREILEALLAATED
ncbi:MAG TPA: alpha/beta hydrolase [Longimicrobiales bacterium]|nr:alpha/beta hydrolase [Longimicrobiales bacterium]